MNAIKTIFIRGFGNVLYFLLNKFVKKDIVLIDTCFDNVLDGNMAIVYDYFKDTDEVVVIKNDIRSLYQNDIYKKTLKYYYYLSKAKLVFNNNLHHLYVKKNRATVIVDTWHGTPYKYVGVSGRAKKILSIMKKNTTYHISGNEYFDKIYLEESISYKGDIIRNGFFRNDILFANNKFYTDEEFVLNGKKNILICPTWRDYGNDELINRINSLTALLNNELNDYNILIRVHNKMENIKFENCYNVSDYDYQIQKLLTITDVLITDYSSVFFDYAILEKPIILYQYDKDRYAKERGLLIDDIEKDYGLNVFYNENSILDFIKNINLDSEKIKVNNFNKKINQYETGKSFELFIDLYKKRTNK